MTGIEAASVETIEQECRVLENDLDQIMDQVRIHHENLRHLERRAAMVGGEPYLDLAEKSQLDSVRRSLEEKELEYQHIRRNLFGKKAELQRYKEMDVLWRQLDRSLDQKQLEKAWTIAGRLKALDPSLVATINSELVRFHWQMVVDAPPEDWTAARKAWEKLETVCYEIGDDEGLKSARQGLASSFEERAEEKEDQEQFRSAVYFYRRALDKYEADSHWSDQQRVLDKLIRVHWNLGDLEAALRHSSARLDLLGRSGRPREAEHCYFQALKICLDLLEESPRSHWELELTSLVADHLDRLNDVAGLEHIKSYSVRGNKPAIHQLVAPVLEEVIERFEQPLKLAA
jgi:tetratricopeptide (TPR) repeat protein